MSSRLQAIYNNYNRRKIEIENNEKIMKDVLNSLKVMRSSLSEETLAIINTYQPGLMELLNFENLNDLGNIENIEKVKTNLNYVLETLLSSMERELV